MGGAKVGRIAFFTDFKNSLEEGEVGVSLCVASRKPELVIETPHLSLGSVTWSGKCHSREAPGDDANKAGAWAA